MDFWTSRGSLPVGLIAMGSCTLLSCGGAASATEANSAETPAPSTAAPEQAEQDMSAEEAALLAQIEESAAIADQQAESAGGEQSDGQEPRREVVYRLGNDGLKIEVLGAEFVPHAESVAIRGGYGVKLTVTARTTRPLVLYAPVQGPLAFGGKVQRGEVETFGDTRQGGAQVAFEPGSPIQFERTWPAEDEEPLKPGEELELHVGLWGLGNSEEDRRPVNRFLVVKMSASTSGAVPRIEPPAN